MRFCLAQEKAKEPRALHFDQLVYLSTFTSRGGFRGVRLVRLHWVLSWEGAAGPPPTITYKARGRGTKFWHRPGHCSNLKAKLCHWHKLGVEHQGQKIMGLRSSSIQVQLQNQHFLTGLSHPSSHFSRFQLKMSSFCLPLKVHLQLTDWLEMIHLLFAFLPICGVIFSPACYSCYPFPITGRVVWTWFLKTSTSMAYITFPEVK